MLHEFLIQFFKVRCFRERCLRQQIPKPGLDGKLGVPAAPVDQIGVIGGSNQGKECGAAGAIHGKSYGKTLPEYRQTMIQHRRETLLCLTPNAGDAVADE